VRETWRRRQAFAGGRRAAAMRLPRPVCPAARDRPILHLRLQKDAKRMAENACCPHCGEVLQSTNGLVGPADASTAGTIYFCV
jgi:hypothetical protein